MLLEELSTFQRTARRLLREGLPGQRTSFSLGLVSRSAGQYDFSSVTDFLAECTGLVWALLLSPTSRVRRRNGDKVPMSPVASWKQEFVALGKHMMLKKV